jgi:hypothetical protein
MDTVIVKNNRWMNPAQLKDEFGIGLEAQSKWRQKKKIPYSKIGGFVFYDRNLIDKWLESHTNQVA